MVLGLIFAVGGLAVLAVASDQFVRGAARLAVIFRVAPVVVGAIVIGFGTSAPEMVVSGLAAAEGNLDIGVGNVIGSNVANLSLVLGAATFVTVIPVRRRTLRREAPLSMAAVAVFAVLAQGEITRFEGGLLALLLVLALGFIVRSSRGDKTLVEDADDMFGDDPPSIRLEVSRTLIALVVVVVSSWFLVEGAVRVAEALDLTGGFVGFTLVAVGTSMPELVTAVAAARQGQTELLIGNLLGSNLFNSLAVGSVIAFVGPGPVLDTRLAEQGSLLMVGVVLVSWLMMATGSRVTRREGAVLLLMWVACIVVLA